MVRFNIDSKIRKMIVNPFILSKDIISGSGFLKGILLLENEDIQITYIVDYGHTYTLMFILSGCRDCLNVNFSSNKTFIDSIDIRFEQNAQVRFVESTNKIDITCNKLQVKIDETISKKYGERQAEILTKQYSNELIQKFDNLKSLILHDSSSLFKCENKHNGIEARHHTMYKLKTLLGNDERLTYEFLIEFDNDDPCLGIYYGCKVLLKDGISDEEHEEIQDNLLQEWEKLKPEVCKRLDLTFPTKRFTNRFKHTDNSENNTFWPSWISLYEDENIQEVAVRALIIIRDEYKRHLEGADYMSDKTCRYVVKNVTVKENEIHSQTRFTEESWQYFADTRKYNNWMSFLVRFINGAIREQVLIKDDRYEKAFQYHGTNIRFAVMMQLLANRVSASQSVPWVLVCRHFLDENGDSWTEEDLKNPLSRYWSDLKEKYRNHGKIWDDRIKRRLEDNPRFAEECVAEFKRIMD